MCSKNSNTHFILLHKILLIFSNNTFPLYYWIFFVKKRKHMFTTIDRCVICRFFNIASTQKIRHNDNHHHHDPNIQQYFPVHFVTATALEKNESKKESSFWQEKTTMRDVSLKKVKAVPKSDCIFCALLYI